jgi:predicted Zn-dependent peptidase
LFYNFEEFSLNNGLKVIVHEDHSIPIAVLNILYNVGSKDESEDKTGFAHLFEHLMFGGSTNIKSFDEPLQKVGGENNAFTSPDITNYYISIPSANLETAFWLESDRMLSLSFEEKVLEIQRKVVIEEFKQRYLNQPYGDVWLKLRPLAYKTHPYKWPTIGKDISHIETASMEDVMSFFNKFYIPNNATLVVAGDVKTKDVKELADKWFGNIPEGIRYIRQLPQEPVQKESRRQVIEANVPLDAIYVAFHMPGRLDTEYYAGDLISDLLGRGKTSRLYQSLVKDKSIFNSINAYVTGSVDPGLLVISGKIKNGISPESAEGEIIAVIEEFIDNGISDDELRKVKNQAYTALAFQDVEILNRAMNLAFFTNLGDPNLVNEEKSKIEKVNIDKILSAGQQILKESNRNILNYNSRK